MGTRMCQGYWAPRRSRDNLPEKEVVPQADVGSSELTRGQGMWKQEGHRGEQKDRLEQNTRWILRSGLNTGVHAQRLGPSQL